MKESPPKDRPDFLPKIQLKSKEMGFTMPSDELVGSLLRTLVASKRAANFLELGTGTGLSLSWMADGMCADSKITSIDNDPELIKVARGFFAGDPRISIIEEDGSRWVRNYKGEKFDLVFADAWPGKYSELDEILDIINPGGFYIIDDMVEQPNWPKGHQQNVNNLVLKLEERKDFVMTKLNWATGIIVMVKK